MQDVPIGPNGRENARAFNPPPRLFRVHRRPGVLQRVRNHRALCNQSLRVLPRRLGDAGEGSRLSQTSQDHSLEYPAGPFRALAGELAAGRADGQQIMAGHHAALDPIRVNAIPLIQDVDDPSRPRFHGTPQCDGEEQKLVDVCQPFIPPAQYYGRRQKFHFDALFAKAAQQQPGKSIHAPLRIARVIADEEHLHFRRDRIASANTPRPRTFLAGAGSGSMPGSRSSPALLARQSPAVKTANPLTVDWPH